jgi:hypothetical protein
MGLGGYPVWCLGPGGARGLLIFSFPLFAHNDLLLDCPWITLVLMKKKIRAAVRSARHPKIL